MSEKCGTPCEVEPEEQAEAEEQAYEEAMGAVLKSCSTEQLVEALKSRGYTKITLEDG